MLPIQIVRYIYFGTLINTLLEPKEDWPIHGEDGIINKIDEYFGYLDELKLKVTWRASQVLSQFGKNLAETDVESVLSKEGAEQLKEIMNRIIYTLGAEAQVNIAYTVTDKRIDINKLLQDVSALMAPNIFSSLPSVGQNDFTEAGRCIAFELPTAAAFHILRGTESVLRHFYCCYVKRNRIQNRMWGPIVIALQKCKNPPPVPLTDNLDNIRKSFRNPTQHPDKIYDVEEVQDLFSLCVDVINRMVNHEKWEVPYC